MNKRHKWQKRKSARLKNIREREREKKEKLIYSKKYIICYFSVKSYNFLIALDKMKLSAS